MALNVIVFYLNPKVTPQSLTVFSDIVHNLSHHEQKQSRGLTSRCVSEIIFNPLVQVHSWVASGENLA